MLTVPKERGLPGGAMQGAALWAVKAAARAVKAASWVVKAASWAGKAAARAMKAASWAVKAASWAVKAASWALKAAGHIMCGECSGLVKFPRLPVDWQFEDFLRLLGSELSLVV